MRKKIVMTILAISFSAVATYSAAHFEKKTVAESSIVAKAEEITPSKVKTYELIDEDDSQKNADTVNIESQLASNEDDEFLKKLDEERARFQAQKAQFEKIKSSKKTATIDTKTNKADDLPYANDVETFELKTDTSTNATSHDKIIFVGDSRFVGIKAAIGKTKDEFIAKIGMGLKWFKSKEDKIKDAETKKSTIVIGFGVNDLGNINDYINYVNKADFSSKIFFLTVNPVDETKYTEISNDSIDNFNETLKENAKNYTVIDTNTFLKINGFDSTDGLHYDSETYIKLYNYIVEKIESLK